MTWGEGCPEVFRFPTQTQARAGPGDADIRGSRHHGISTGFRGSSPGRTFPPGARSPLTFPIDLPLIVAQKCSGAFVRVFCRRGLGAPWLTKAMSFPVENRFKILGLGPITGGVLPCWTGQRGPLLGKGRQVYQQPGTKGPRVRALKGEPSP